MKFGFDLDDVVIDLIAEVEKFVAINYGIEWSSECSLYHEVSKNCYHSDEEINEEIIEKLIDIFKDPDFCTAAEPIDGARETLQKFKRAGHELCFISARPKQLQPSTFTWMRRNDIPFDSLFLIGRDEPKGLVGRRQNLDMYVDDLEANLQSMFRYKKRWRKGLLLFTKSWNESSIDASKFKRVHGWKEILRHVGIQNR